jgi:hypothetical protein
MVQQPDGSYSKRVPWKNLSQESVRKLAEIPAASAFVEPLVEWTPEERVKDKAEAYKLDTKPSPKMDRSAKAPSKIGSLFKSPVALTLLALFYLGNIWIGYEIAIFKNRPAALICGVAAVVPLFGNLIFGLVPPAPVRTQEEIAAEAAAAAGIVEDTTQAPTITNPHAVARAAEAAAAQAAVVAAAPAGPQAVIYARGQFTFNRRFFESKLAPFCRAILAPEDEGKQVVIISLRGDYTGHHIASLDANGLLLQVRKGDVSENVMIPYNEVREIQIRPSA